MSTGPLIGHVRFKPYPPSQPRKTKMGQWLSGPAQPREIRVIYTELPDGTVLPIAWPPTLADFHEEAQWVMGQDPETVTPHYVFLDGTGRVMQVMREAHFRALVPIYETIKDEVKIFHVSVKLTNNGVLKQKTCRRTDGPASTSTRKERGTRNSTEG